MADLSEKLKGTDFYLQFSGHYTANHVSTSFSDGIRFFLCQLSITARCCCAKATGLQGTKRRVIYVSLYEAIAIIVSSLIFMAIGQNASDSGVMAVAASVIAICWNLSFNYLFEKWEAPDRQGPLHTAPGGACHRL